MATRVRRREATQNRIKALSHPLRAELLVILTERTASPIEMARELNERVGAVSHHVKRLVELGCAELVDERAVRGAVEHFYRATTRTVVHTEEWEQLAPEVAQNFVGEIVQTILDDVVESVKAKLLGTNERFHLTRTRLVLDEQGLREALEIHEKARLEILDVQARSVERMAESGETGTPASSSHGCFELPS